MVKETQVLVLQLGGPAITELKAWLWPDGLACLAPTASAVGFRGWVWQS